MQSHIFGIMGVLFIVAAGETQAQSIAKTDLPTAKPERVGVSTERLQRIHETVQRFMDAHRIPGAVTLIARKGRVVHFEAQGAMDAASGKPMQTNTLFALASMTKPVTGVAVMMLVEEGKIQIADPVAKYIPEFQNMKVAVQEEGHTDVQLMPAARPITIHDLLTHTSGLATGGVGAAQVKPEVLFPNHPDETLATFTARLATVPLDFQPGTRWRYSGLAGIDVLARIVEIASGQTFDAFLRQRIFEPLGMKETFFHVPDSLKDRVATIYQSDGTKLTPLPPFLNFPQTFFSASGGLSSTAEDFFKFAQMLCNKGEYNGHRLLSPRSVELMSSNHVGDMFPGNLGRPKGMGFGYTVEVVVDSAAGDLFRANGSFGWDGAFGTHFWVDPKDDLVAILMIQLLGGQIMHRSFETAVLQSLIE